MNLEWQANWPQRIVKTESKSELVQADKGKWILIPSVKALPWESQGSQISHSIHFSRPWLSLNHPHLNHLIRLQSTLRLNNETIAQAVRSIFYTLSDEDETVKSVLMADQSEPGIFEQTLPDPTPTQVQCMTPVSYQPSKNICTLQETNQVTGDTDWYRDYNITSFRLFATTVESRDRHIV